MKIRLWPRKRLGLRAREKEIAILLLEIQERRIKARIARHAMEQDPTASSKDWWALHDQLEIMYNRVRRQLITAKNTETLPPNWFDRLVIAIARWALAGRT